MARGGKGGGKRGSQRGRGNGSSASGAAGFPSNAQGTRTSQAQSGGVANSFQGTAGGGRAFGNKGGSATQRSISTGTNNLGQKYQVHSPGGDNTLVPGGFKGAGKLNLQPQGNTGKTNASIVDPHELAPKGFGGGY